ncbi:hypothetical protein [Lacunimicrobium album]
MSLRCLLFLMLFPFAISTAQAEEYVLILERLQKSAYGDEEIEWVKAKTVARLETDIKLDRDFHVRVRQGFKILTLKGRISRGEKETFTTKITARAEKEMVDLTFVAGGKEPVVEMNSISSTATLKLDIPQMLGMSWSGGMTKENQHYTSQDEFVITMSRSEVEKK